MKRVCSWENFCSTKCWSFQRFTQAVKSGYLLLSYINYLKSRILKMFVVSDWDSQWLHMICKISKTALYKKYRTPPEILDVEFGIFCVGYKGSNSLAIFLCQVSVEYKYSFKINFTKFLYHSYHNSKKNSFSILLHPLKLLKLNWLKFKNLAGGFMWINQLVRTEIPKI